MAGATGSAPGRLDVLGGVADYSGALVLEMPTRQSIEVVAEADDALVVGSAVLSVVEMARLAELDYDDVRRALEGLPRWTHYLIGVAVVLVRHGVIAPPRARLRISSDLPQSMGVASSAALEVATARALGAGVHRPAAVGPVVPGGGELRGRRAVRRHGPSGGGTRIARCRAADSLPPGVTLARRDAPAGSRDRRLAQRRRTRRERRALPTGPCRGLHGEAHRRRVPKSDRGPGSASSPRRPRPGSPRRSAGPNFSSGGARPVT